MPVTLQIAPALPSDAQVIAEMSRRLVEVGLPWTWTPARVARHLQHPQSLVLAVRTNGTSNPMLVAFAIMHFGDDIAHLNLLAGDWAAVSWNGWRNPPSQPGRSPSVSRCGRGTLSRCSFIGNWALPRPAEYPATIAAAKTP